MIRRLAVLLLEDNEWDARMASEAMVAAPRVPIDIRHVKSLGEAREALRKETFDAIVADLNLPDTSGSMTIRRLRAIAGDEPGIVVLTSVPDDEAGPDSLLYGADEFVPKSVMDRAGSEILSRAIQLAVERRRADRDLAALARQHEQTLQAIPDVITRVDPRGRITWTNHAGEALFGRPLHDIVGLRATDLVPPEESKMVDVALARSLEGEAHAVATIPRPDGSARMVKWTGAPLVDRHGSVVGSVGVGRDITTEIEAQTRAKELAERTAEAERLRTLQRERTRFFNVMAHEVNNPLTILIMQVDLLKEHVLGDITEEQAKALVVLDTTLDRLRALMTDLLDTSRVQSGDLKLRPAPMDLRDVARDAVGGYDPVAAKAGVALEVDATAALPVLADPRRMSQVLLNFLTNAVKFTPHGGRVRVECAAEGKHAVVRVRDTGAGLAPEQISKLFQPFSQAHPDDPDKGTGLGLYICKGIVDAHGGSVGCESAGPGQGSTFWMRLPLRGAAS